MKKGLLLVLGAVLVGTALLFSCQKTDELAVAEQELMLKSAAAYPEDGCNTVCITPGSGDYFLKEYTHTFDATAPAKTVTVKVYNTETHLVYEVTSQNCDFKHLKFNGNFEVNNAVTTSWKKEILLDADWKACDLKEATIEVYRNNLNGTGGGQYAKLETSYNLIGVCQGCEETFNYQANEDGTYTFTYVPAEDMVNAQLVFTFPQSALAEGLGEEWGYNGQTAQATMNLKACQEYTWTVKLVCKELNNPQNKWTDFKVNNVSKKGNLANIKC